MAFPGRSLRETAAAERGWWERLVRRVVDEAGLGGVLSGERFDHFFTDLFAHFTTEEAWEPYPDALPVLAGLQAEGIVLGLITNYDTRVYPVLDAVGLTPFFDSVTIPALAGAAKPDPAIFLHALRTHHLDPAEAAYVGDEPGDDYAGATAAGLRAILLDRKDRHKDAAVRRIRSLEELRPAAPPLARAPRTRRPR
jgi:putative hydrolase of the HAD superfamily